MALELLHLDYLHWLEQLILRRLVLQWPGFLVLVD
jgi:hypothetical protein